MYNNSDGVIHWHSLRRFHGFVELVLLFDMSQELFHVTQMPEKYNAVKAHHRNPLKVCHFLLLRDSLAVNFSIFKERCAAVELWAMKKSFYQTG